MKKVSTYKGWKIYSGFNSEYNFSAFLPEMSPSQFDVAEWEADSIEELKEFIDCY